MDIDFLTIRQIKNGDAQAAEQLIRKYYPEILRYCYLHVQDRGDAEDMTQETFARFFCALGNYEHRGKTKNYLYTIAANLCRNHAKKVQPILMEQLPEQGVEPMSQTEARVDILSALAQLPEEQRQVTILYFYRDCKLKEIAGILGISPTLARRRLERAKENLRKLLEEEV